MAKIFQFLTQNMKISQQQQMLKTLKFFQNYKFTRKHAKNFGGPILNKNTFQKNSWGGGRAFPPPPES